MPTYDEKPWLSLYDPDQPAEISLEFTDALSMFRASARRNPDGDAIRYFGGRITERELDELSDAFAGGYKVWPREVEDVLYQHEAVREAAVVGVPDAYRGETVKAYVSLRPGQTATAEELIAFCREQMAAYKYPRQVEFLDELPKTVSGKLLRRELRDRG